MGLPQLEDLIRRIDFVGLAALVVVLVVVILRLLLSLRRLRAHYKPIAGIEEHLAKANQELEQTKRERTKLLDEYQRAKGTYEALKSEVARLEENLEDISYGLYRPHFDFQTSAEYKAKLEALRERERGLIQDGRAATCSAQWTVGGSAKEGERMARQNTKLVLRAFNGECDAALAKVAWNNITRMEDRVEKSFEAINKLGTVLQVAITSDYLRLKLDELRLTHECEQKRREEQEEQRRIQARIREEERVQREIEKAREEAERDEARFEKALEKARQEAAQATGGKLQELNDRIGQLQTELEAAHQQKERAISRAEQTKSGHVYVISNVGSFGEGVYKVGMTRRLEPMERIDELGDASVPFPFDVHAMLYSENAPELEAALHGLMSERRVNLVNIRKEFFRLTLEEIEKVARDRGVTVEFTKLAEAQEYRQTIAFRQQAAPAPVQEPEKFPADLFGAASDVAPA